MNHHFHTCANPPDSLSLEKHVIIDNYVLFVDAELIFRRTGRLDGHMSPEDCKNSSHAFYHSFFIDPPDTFNARVHSCVSVEKYMALKARCSSTLAAIQVKSVKKAYCIAQTYIRVIFHFLYLNLHLFLYIYIYIGCIFLTNIWAWIKKGLKVVNCIRRR